MTVGGSMAAMRMRASREPERLVLALYGELDLSYAPALQQQLEAVETGGPHRVVVDLSGLEFMDSTGLQVLLCADRRLRENGQELFLRRGPTAIQRLFELTQTDAIFRFED